MKKSHLLIVTCIILCSTIGLIAYVATKDDLSIKEYIQTQQSNVQNTGSVTQKELLWHGWLSPTDEVRKISSDALKDIKRNMTYEEIIKKLGVTKDSGSGIYIFQYVVDERLNLKIGFNAWDEICPLDGEELLKKATPIH